MKQVWQKIGRQFWLYLVCIFTFIILWNGVFGFLTRIPAEEKVTVFIASRSETFAGSEELSRRRPESLRAVEVRCAVPDSMYFDVYLSIWGYTQADILILPASLIEKGALSERFCPISASYAASVGRLGTLDADGSIYGIRVYDATARESLIADIAWGEGDDVSDYYLLFGRNSAHLGSLSETDGVGADGAAARVAELLMEL